MAREPDYDGAAIVRALRAVGLRPGDVVFCHSSVARLGVPAVGLDEQAVGALFLAAFREALGPEGTLILPAFTYSYAKGEGFDPAATPPTPAMGALPNALWRHPDAVRSLDPIFSAIAFGARARELVERAGAEDCFGAGSLYALLLELDAIFLNVGLRGTHLQMTHHVEQLAGVPYRFIKRFRGTTVVDGTSRETEVAYFVRALDEPRHEPTVARVFADAAEQGVMTAAPLGRGEVNALRSREVERLVLEGLARDPGYLVVGNA